MDSTQQKKRAQARYRKQALGGGKSGRKKDIGAALARHSEQPSRRSLRSRLKGKGGRSRATSERSRTGGY